MRAWRAALLAALLGAPALAAELPLKAMRWIAPEADRVAVLTRAPGECLAPSTDPAVEIGRAAFRSPLLLGGQAARAGLSCESCHVNGRGNPTFRFPGISGAAGTADVTASLFSRTRGDGVHNPKPIPDLGTAPRTVPPVQLRGFIKGLVVDEFDGPHPPAAVLDGLVAYVSALRPEACPAETAVTAGAQMEAARRAVAAARGALAGGDPATAAVMLMAARAQLGLLHERYPAPAPRAGLLASDAALASALTAVRAADPRAAERLAQWNRDSTRLNRILTANEAQSLFDPARLAAAIAAPAARPDHEGGPRPAG